MSGRVKIKIKDKKPKIDVFKVIESRFKNMNELRDLIDMDPRKGLVRIRDGAGFREVERGGCLHRNYLNLLEDELGAKLSIDLIERYIKAAFFNELAKGDIKVCKSHKHHDGEECFGGGWFIVMAELPTGQISNHYENRYWELFNIPELDTAWEWDGHTSNEAADRIESYLKSN